MDNQQAKLILSAYRPGGEDATDPFFAEALEQVRRDPDLGRWLAGQRDFDRSMHSAVQSIAPPAGLREQLLITMQIARPDAAAPQLRRFWSRPAPWLAMAASILILLGIGVLFHAQQPAPLSAGHLIDEIFDLKQSDRISLGKMGGGMDELRTWLARQGSPSDFDVPAGLEALGGIGCQTFAVRGHKVSLVCFMLDKERVVHFFVMDSSGIEHPPGLEPDFIQRHGLAAATWSAGGRTYLVVGENVDEEILRRLI